MQGAYACERLIGGALHALTHALTRREGAKSAVAARLMGPRSGEHRCAAGRRSTRALTSLRDWSGEEEEDDATEQVT